MSGEKLHNEETLNALQHDDDAAPETSYVPDGGEQDPLEEDEGVRPDEVHSESSSEAQSGSAEPPTYHAPGPQEPPAAGPAKNWYIIHAYSGFENKVAESLRTRAQAFGFADRVGQILIPTEEVVELRNGKKIISKRLLYPGYVLVEMEMDDELWHAVKSTPRVTGFVGGGTKPVPLSADEVNAVLYRQNSPAERPRPKMTFEKNETVKIIDGPFTNFSGKVDEINTERNTLRVMVTIFGRSTPVELDFLQVEKI
ncbi:MAG: transcription termination/antitermination protein NusG [Acidobacteriaceae bacterium]|nr:transcription termination/antitermination protein NusG [Acidobacteriaceae bacterium]MBV9497736.1 transcription termination/antitermination protein NusG [Acidobacteriaceae bacterium]